MEHKNKKGRMGGEEGTKGEEEPTLTRRGMFEMQSDGTNRQCFVNYRHNGLSMWKVLHNDYYQVDNQ